MKVELCISRPNRASDQIEMRRQPRARTLHDSISMVQSVLVGATRRSSTGATSNPRSPMRRSPQVNVPGPVPAGAKLSSAPVLRRDSTASGWRRNSPTLTPETPSGSGTRSRRLADSRARRPARAVGAWPAPALASAPSASASASPLATATLHASRSLRLFLATVQLQLHVGMGIGWRSARVMAAGLAAVSLIPSPACFSAATACLQPRMKPINQPLAVGAYRVRDFERSCTHGQRCVVPPGMSCCPSELFFFPEHSLHPKLNKFILL